MSKFLSCIEADSTSLVATNYQLDILEESLSAIVVEEDWKKNLNSMRVSAEELKKAFIEKVRVWAANLKKIYDLVIDNIKKLIEAAKNKKDELLKAAKEKLNKGKKEEVKYVVLYLNLDPNKNDIEKILNFAKQAHNAVTKGFKLYNDAQKKGQLADEEVDYFDNFKNDAESYLNKIKDIIPEAKEKYQIQPVEKCKNLSSRYYRICDELGDMLTEVRPLVDQVETTIVDASFTNKFEGNNDTHTLKPLQHIGSAAALFARVIKHASMTIIQDECALSVAGGKRED